MRIPYFIFICFILISEMISGQELKGTVKDGQTGEVLIGALIHSGNKHTVTDLNGTFIFEIEQNMDTILVSFIGYENVVLVPDVVRALGTIEIEMNSKQTLLDATVVVGSKFEQRIAESSVSIERISPLLMESNHALNPEAILTKIPGVDIIDGQANIRGGSGYSYGAGSRVLLLVDDIPALQSDAGSPNWDDIAIENVESIEILKGAASALYGSSALNGIINVRSAKVGIEPETKFSGTFGLFGSPDVDSLKWWDSSPYEWQLNIQHKRRLGKLDLIASAFLLDRKSYNKDTYDTYGRTVLHLQYRLKDNMTFRLNSNFNTGEKGSFFYWKGSGALYEGDTSTLTVTNYARFNIDPQWIWHQHSSLRHSIKARYYYVDNKVPRMRSNKSSLGYVEYNLQKRWIEQDLTLNAGLTGINTYSKAELYGDTSYTSQNAAIFGQVEKKIWSKLNLSGGFRYEYNRLNSPVRLYQDSLFGGVDEESRPVFRFGLNYEAAKVTFIRASWGQGYRYPTIAEKYVATDLGIIFISPNPKLESETGWNVELGIRQGFRSHGIEGFVDMSIFRSEYQDMMEFIFTGFVEGFQSQNTGDTRIQGIDISVGAQGTIGEVEINGIGGITLLDPRYQLFTFEDSLRSSVNYNILKYRNKRNIKFDLEGKYQNFTLGFAYHHSSHMEAIDGIFEIFINGLKDYRQQNMNGFHKVDARIAYSYRNMRFSLLGQNLLNQAYTLRPALMEAPRNLSFRFDIDF